MPLKEINSPSEGTGFPIIAIGGSAGGMQALAELLHHLPADLGLAYLYIQHMNEDYESNLVTIVQRETKIPVIEAEDGMHIQPDHIYIFLSNKIPHIENGLIRFDGKPTKPRPTLAINNLFCSVAEYNTVLAVGIVLSGAGSDGTIGLRTIKMEGGITFAQDDSAEFQSMPKNAAAEGAADFVLSPADIAGELISISEQRKLLETYLTPDEKEDEAFKSILHLLNRSVNVDFTNYKTSTIRRRVVRRMLLYKLDSYDQYLTYMRKNTAEPSLLYQDLLINVTTFFRDPEALDFLAKEVLPKIISLKQSSDPLRIWVPACSTGQEAYSLAMTIVDLLGERHTSLPIQIFATDLSDSAIAKARQAVYSKDEVQGINQKRLQKFFTKIDGSYRVVKTIRDLCVFATHNITKDPPFSKLDIISCCNLLIYLDKALQKKLISTFHYSLANLGYLVLGKSETIGDSGALFTQLQKRYKVYSKKKDTAANAAFEMSYRHYDLERKMTFDSKGASAKVKGDDNNLEKVIDNMLIKRYAPASVLVTAELDIIQFRGPIGLFLEPSPGKASLNLLKMARAEIALELRNIVHKAQKTSTASNKDGVQISMDGVMTEVILEALPVKTSSDEEYYLVTFQQKQLPEDINTRFSKDNRVSELEGELMALREDMRSIVESQEAANEELQSANEEIVSSNEELQSINEELETSKEELESSNEELITINQELQVRNEQLAEAQEYAEAVISTIREAILILDKDFRIKSANATFYRTFNLKEEETEGTLLYELNGREWDIPALRTRLRDIKEKNHDVSDIEIATDFPVKGKKLTLLNGRKVAHGSNSQLLIMFSVDDISYPR